MYRDLSPVQFQVLAGEGEAQSRTLKLSPNTRLLLRKRLKQPREIPLADADPGVSNLKAKPRAGPAIQAARHLSPLRELESIVQQIRQGLSQGILVKDYSGVGRVDGTRQRDTLALSYDLEVRQQML